MERTIVWTVLAIGVLGMLGTIALSLPRVATRDRKEAFSSASPLAPEFVAIALTLPLLTWLATLLSAPPFAPGGGWGQGFVCGAILSLLSALIMLRGARQDGENAEHRSPAFSVNAEMPNRRRVCATAPLFAALIAVALPHLFGRSSLIDALNGVAMGWLAIASVLWLGLRDVASSRRITILLLVGTGFAVTLCLGTMLGVYRDVAASGAVAAVARDAHATSALVLGAGVPLSLFCAALLATMMPSRHQSTLITPHVLTALLGVALLLSLGYLLSTRLLSAPRGLYVVEIGLLAGLLMAWTARAALPVDEEQNLSGSDRTADRGDQSTLDVVPSPLPVLVALGAFVVSYQLWQGFGAGLMLLAAWPLAFSAVLSVDETVVPQSGGARSSQAAHDAFGQSVTAALFFAVVLLASRVFDTGFRDVLRVAFASDQHALFGLLIGVLLPVWGVRHLSVASSSSRSDVILRAITVAVPLVLVPGWLVALWGVRPLPSLFAGLALCAASSALFGARSRIVGRAEIGTPFLALGVALLLVQWTGRVLPLAEASRGQRLQWLLWGAALAVLIVLFGDLLSRALQRRHTKVNRQLAGGKP